MINWFAHLTWSSAPAPTVPVLAVTQIGGQQFVYVAENKDGHYIAVQKTVQLGDTVGNFYEVKSGLQAGDKVIVSGNATFGQRRSSPTHVVRISSVFSAPAVSSKVATTYAFDFVRQR